MMSEVKNTNRATAGERGGLSPLRRIGVYALIALGVFLLGFLPMWITARARADERDEARRQLRLSRTENRLASAALDARRGEYEQARNEASEFFTSLRAEIDRTQDRALTADQVERARAAFATRDEVITLLARSDPASAERLADLYVAYRNALGAGAAKPTTSP
jgi:hypothetical protein